jgi:hypothetical protein
MESSPLGRASWPGGAALDHLRARGEPIRRDGGLKMPLAPSTKGPRSPWRRSRPPFVGQAIQKDGHRLDCELRDHGAWGDVSGRSSDPSAVSVRCFESESVKPSDVPTALTTTAGGFGLAAMLATTKNTAQMVRRGVLATAFVAFLSRMDIVRSPPRVMRGCCGSLGLRVRH